VMRRPVEKSNMADESGTLRRYHFRHTSSPYCNAALPRIRWSGPEC
jgi:hypothetical protein